MSASTTNFDGISKMSASHKGTKITYWITTGLLALFILSGSLFMNSSLAIEGTRHIGLPEWFRWELNIGHLIAGLLLILPVGKRLKEWTYVALGIDYVSAVIAHLSVDGPVPVSFSPLVTLALLIVSYTTYHKLSNQNLYVSAKNPAVKNAVL